VGPGSVLQIFTVLERSLPLDGGIGLGKVLLYVSRLDKAWLKGQGRSQHWLALVCMPFAPADGVMRHAHLNRVPSVLAGAANPSPHHFVWQVAIGDWCPVFFATALGTIH